MMSKLWLYAVFHINLAFSSIPRSHYALLLDRCYWPLLDVACRMGLPFAFEATGYSLDMLNRVDASFVRALKEAWHQEQIEFVGSGYTQSILPLCPVAVNQQNLLQGNAVYESLLGRKPTTAYVNEQTYASGLVDLYLEAGYDTLFMEWNNPARFHPEAKSWRYRPQRAMNPDGSRAITVVWNDSIAFQKLQRLLDQSLTQADYLAYLSGHVSPDEDRGFPIYGSDAEIVDYHPGLLEAEYLASSGTQDIQRLVALLEAMQSDDRFAWTTPGRFAQTLDTAAMPIRLESPAYPLPCKKQPKYNPTRWAVSGREDIHLNTRCYQRALQLLALQTLSPQSVTSEMWRYLLEKWGSDFRTHTTEEKWQLLRQTAASLELSLDEAFLPLLQSSTQDPITMVLWNPNETPYVGPLSLEVQFPHGVLHGYPVLASHPVLSQTQIEGVGYYQDGSVRWVKAVLLVNLPSREWFTLHWESGEKPRFGEDGVRIAESPQTCEIHTDTVTLKLLLNRGGAVQSLRFNALDDKPWLGTLPHGYFEDIALGADFYSGHMILESKTGEKATDLNPAKLQFPQPVAACPIRIPLQVGLSTSIGNVWKTLYVYRSLPRVDCLYHFRFRDISAPSCRVGIATILPDAFEHDSLAYRTVNGGYQSERFALKGSHVTHSDPVSILVSAQHGLGATEGWVAVEDRQNRLILRTYPHEAYAMPMIHYEEAAPGYFLRLLPSIGEFDDTSHQLWRGHHQVMFTWEGQRAAQPVEAPMPPVSLSPHVRILPV